MPIKEIAKRKEEGEEEEEHHGAGESGQNLDSSGTTAASGAAGAYQPDNTEQSLNEGRSALNALSTVDETSLHGPRARYVEDVTMREESNDLSPAASHNHSSGASNVAGGGIGDDEAMGHVSSRGLFSDESEAHENSGHARLRESQDSPPASHDEGALKGGWGYAGNKHMTKEEMANIVAVSKMKWGSDPQMFKCPYCQNEDFSANHMEHTPFVWTGVALVCLFGCWFGCCLVPLCSDSIKNVRHQCSKCHRVVGYRRAFGMCRVGTHRTCCCGRDEFVEYIADLDQRTSQLQSNAGLPADDNGSKLYTF